MEPRPAFRPCAQGETKRVHDERTELDRREESCEARSRTSGAVSVTATIKGARSGNSGPPSISVLRSYPTVTSRSAFWLPGQKDPDSHGRRHDPKANATRKRPESKKARRGVDAVPFDPAEAMLDEATGREPYHEGEDD